MRKDENDVGQFARRETTAALISCLILTVVTACNPATPSAPTTGSTASPSAASNSGVPTRDNPTRANGSQDVEHPLFVDYTTQAGLNFQHQAGGDQYFVPRSIGSGVALFDADGDGQLDIYLVQNAGRGSGVTNKLFRQLPDHTFEDVSPGAGLDVDGHGMGCAAGDVNNDGRVDLVVTEYGDVRLFLNQTAGEQVKFVDATDAAALRNPAWGTSAAFFDYDRDGWLDLVIANYLDYDPSRRCTDAAGREDFCGPQSFAPVVARLFRNLGGSPSDAPLSAPPAADSAAVDSTRVPRFEDVTVAAGMATATGAGLGVSCADFDGDGWPDIVVANDGVPNTLWINQRNGLFLEEAGQRGLAYNAMGDAQAGMGVALGDANSDGLFDVFITHRETETHTLWLQTARGVFIDQTPSSTLTRTSWRGTGFGTAMCDFDNDGDLDVAIANGGILRFNGKPPVVPADVDEFWRPYAQRNQLLLNDGQGHFQDVSSVNHDLCQPARVSRSLACGDIDNDGRLDLVVTSIAGPARWLRNTGPTQHWLIIQAVDPRWNRDAYGAQIQLRIGDRILYREINPGYGYLASNDPRAHFGLGQFDRYDGLHVVWPDGSSEDFSGGATDRLIVIRQGQGTGDADQ